MELIMGMFAFCTGLLVVLGTVGHIEQAVSINVTLVVIQLILGFFLMYLGTEELSQKNNK
jgi:hypothetical protein